MIENEIAKFENPDQLAVELLLVAELREVLLVVVERCVLGIGSWASGMVHLSSRTKLGSDARPARERV